MNQLISTSLLGIVMALFTFGGPARATENEPDARLAFSPRLQLAYFEVQKLRLDKARALIAQETAQDPDNGALQYVENYADMYYLLISEDRKAYARLSKKEDIRLNILASLPESSPYQRLLRAEVRLHWAFVKLKFGDEVSACWDIIKAYRLLEENKRRFPTFVPTLKSLGLLHVLIGSVPEQYTWVTKVLGLSGNIEGGLKELAVVQQRDPFFRQEAGLIDLLLHAFTLQLSPAQIQKLKQLPRDQPDNLLLHFFATSVLMKEGRSEEALAILNKAPRSPAYIPFAFLDYLKAEILLQKGSYKEALTYYSRFQSNFRGFNFLKDSYFKQFLCLWLTGEEEAARRYLADVATMGATITESDQYAQRFAESYAAGKIADEQKILYVARYTSDGGYLTEAWNQLDSYTEVAFVHTESKAEFNYRRGRILQKMGQAEQALPYFERSINLSRDTNLYFGASSALQMGYIYRDQQNKQKAIASFRQALAYKKHEYKNSIDNKARAALSSMGA